MQKAGITALELGQQEKALQYFTRIKEDYPQSAQGSGVDAFIGMAKTSN
ncbi:tetratricopeptide repeat protein [Robiginitalea sp.]